MDATAHAEAEQSVSVETSGDVAVETTQEQSTEVEAGIEIPDMSGAAERVRDHREVFVLVGLPGAGKSTAAEILRSEMAEGYGERAQDFEVSDFVRTVYENEHDGDTTDDNSLGAWAAEEKAEHGQDVFVRDMANLLDTPLTPHVIISGVRSPQEAEAVRDVFGAESVTVIAIWTLPDQRFKRKYGQDTSWESEEFETFTERNERELHEWGALEFYAGGPDADYIVPNNADEQAFEHRLFRVLREVKEDDSHAAEDMRDPPFPDGLPPEHVASYL